MEEGGRGLTDDPCWEDDDVTADDDDVVAVDVIDDWEVTEVTGGGCGVRTGAGCWGKGTGLKDWIPYTFHKLP